MKMVGWILLGVSVVLFLLGVYSKFVGAQSYAFGFAPVAWWRAAMAFAIYCIAFKMLHGDCKD